MSRDAAKILVSTDQRFHDFAVDVRHGQYFLRVEYIDRAEDTYLTCESHYRTYGSLQYGFEMRYI